MYMYAHIIYFIYFYFLFFIFLKNRNLVIKINQKSNLKYLRKLIEFIKNLTSDVSKISNNIEQEMTKNISSITIWKIVVEILEIKLVNIEIFK